MTAFVAIPDAEIDPNKPALSSTMVKMRDNPEAIMQGDATALSAGKGVALDWNGKTAILTDETDTDQRLAPDGTGSVRWVGEGVGKAGSGKDGTVTGISVGCYEAQVVTITAAQTLTGPTEVRCQGAVSITNNVIGTFPLIIRASGNVTITGTVSVSNLFIDSGGTISLSGPVASVDIVALRAVGTIAASDAITAQRCAIESLSGGIAVAAITAEWVGAGPRPGNHGTGTGNCGGGGGGGGHAGGAGGDGEDTIGNAGGAGSLWKSGSRAYLRTVDDMREGSEGGEGQYDSGGGPEPDGTGGAGGGLILIHAHVGMLVQDDLTAVGGASVAGSNANGGGGGGGVIRLSAGGTMTFSGSPVIDASGGSDPSASGKSGGGGGGGMTALAADAFSGTKTTAVAGGTTTDGTAGTAGTAFEQTYTAAEMANFEDAGFFSVIPFAELVTASMIG
jgi:hypothetical protein